MTHFADTQCRLLKIARSRLYFSPTQKGPADQVPAP
jgi:hypothetical protein